MESKTATITLRLEPTLKESLKEIAQGQHIAYQTLVRQTLWDLVKQEKKGGARQPQSS